MGTAFGTRFLLLALLAVGSSTGLSQETASQQTATFSPGKFPTLTFSELVTLSKDEPLAPALETKLNRLLYAAEVDNSFPKSTPIRVPIKDTGSALRISDWNIERGENFDWVVLALKGDEEKFRAALLKDNPKISADALDKVIGEAKILHDSDILILNEVDLGMGRTDYRDVSRDLARALQMNFVYAVEFVEVDPLKLGTEQLTDSDVADDQELKKELESDLKSDPARYKGLHGSAILSRYPISNVQILRLPSCHDWFKDEAKGVSQVEQGKRVASSKIFMEKIEREVRRGGRIAIIADVKVSDAPSGVITLVNAHLENKCQPSCRRGQMNALLHSIQQIQNPVILAGDLNTTGTDASTLSAAYITKSKVKDYRFWAGQALRWGTPMPSTMALNYFKNYNDPTATDIMVIGNNKEAALFNDVEKFQFADGGRFDFRGDSSRTVNGSSGRLANSNQRAAKGFTYTFSLPRDFKGVVGRYRLDWFFVKPSYNDRQRTEALAPWYGRTLMDLNTSPTERISDHAPITVDLPLHPSQ